ncbi:MAG: hypothetical protein JXJ17_09290 [Anaerolineae bacterium]|nr:hypothetical protein [Anaerolineae bacterium]
MLLQDILTGAFILVGAGVMALSIFRTRHVFLVVSKPMFARLWRILVFMMLFFLGGYLLALYFVVSGRTDIVLILTGVIFLFGAVFVYIVVRLGYMTINDLEQQVGERTAELQAHAASIAEANRELEVLSGELEEKVRKRTADLEQRNQQMNQLIKHINSIMKQTMSLSNSGASAADVLKVIEPIQKQLDRSK